MKIELQVQGMTCAHCVARVKNALTAVPGVQAVGIDLATGQVEVKGELMDREALVAAVEDAGYTVSR